MNGQNRLPYRLGRESRFRAVPVRARAPSERRTNSSRPRCQPANHPRALSKKQLIERGIDVVAGLDLGDKHSFVCLIDLDGKLVERKKLRTSPAAFERYFRAWAGMRVVFETGSHANWVYRLLGRLRHELLMADTHRLALITRSLSKPV